jgi:NADH dehydrogenase/NADH:ubiquinone oxidoreductase subunit G
MVKLRIDGREIEAEEGKNLLHTCLEHGIYIPNLCFLEGMKDPPASCRLCFVEIEGVKKPVASCKVAPVDGMVVRTDTQAVRRLQSTALRLLLSVHDAKCRSCPSNRRCELQRMARLLGVRLKPRRYDHLDRTMTAGQDHSLFEFVPSRCVLCGRCIHVCEKRNGYSLLTFAKRGFDTVITSFGAADAERMSCNSCLECIKICPVSAIFLKDEQSEESPSGTLDASH